MKEISVKLLTKEKFEPFGKVIELPDIKPTISNQALDYWGALADLEIEKPQVSFLVVKKRDFIIDRMERHVKPTEVFIPLEGTSVFPVAPPLGGRRKDEVPIDEIAAFLLDGSKGVVMKKGTWHWVPFPTTEKATFAVILGAETVEKDLEIRDIKPPIKISF
ncbi:MAG: ureidoglycolate lyase [Candidatus Bathyarchaeia archaeon]